MKWFIRLFTLFKKPEVSTARHRHPEDTRRKWSEPASISSTQTIFTENAEG
jgi:hypothetical protein